MGHNNVVSGHPKSTVIPWVDRLSTGPPDLGCHVGNLLDYFKLGLFFFQIYFLLSRVTF